MVERHERVAYDLIGVEAAYAYAGTCSQNTHLYYGVHVIGGDSNDVLLNAQVYCLDIIISSWLELFPSHQSFIFIFC